MYLSIFSLCWGEQWLRTNVHDISRSSICLVLCCAPMRQKRISPIYKSRNLVSRLLISQPVFYVPILSYHSLSMPLSLSVGVYSLRTARAFLSRFRDSEHKAAVLVILDIPRRCQRAYMYLSCASATSLLAPPKFPSCCWARIATHAIYTSTTWSTD